MINTHKLLVKKINQFGLGTTHKGVYFGLWEFEKILKSIRFTYRIPRVDIDNYDTNPPKHTRNENDYFQRMGIDERTSKIIDFLIKEFTTRDSLITFPSSFIVSLPLSEVEDYNEYMNLLNSSKNVDYKNETLGAFYNIESQTIVLPEIDIMLIVDGQHRLVALKSLYYAVLSLLGVDLPSDFEDLNKSVELSKRKLNNSYLNNTETLLDLKSKILKFELVCTLLLDFDIWEQGKVFADVNFNQKPVNRSLYYDIYGAFPNEDRNEIYLVHTWCVNLNSNIKSELQNKIKLLGNGNGFISQAFFCDAILPFLRKGGIWWKIANDYTLDRIDSSFKIEKFLTAYFNSIARRFNKFRNQNEYYWPSENDEPRTFDSVLLKTTGLGALIGLIPNFYSLVKDDLNLNIEDLTDVIFKIIDEKLSMENLSHNNTDVDLIAKKHTGRYYFSKTEGAFSGGAGKGLQGKLYKELMKDFNFSKIQLKDQFSLFG